MRRFAAARVNVKLLIGLLLGVALLGGVAVLVRYLQVSRSTGNALAEGKAAFAQEDWQVASRKFREYLSRVPEDTDVLTLLAESQLSKRPRESKHVLDAIGAYRQVLRIKPADAEAFRRLAELYWQSNNTEDLGYVVRERLRVVAEDPLATVWLGKVEIQRRNFEEAHKLLFALTERLERGAQKDPAFVEACNWLSFIAAGQAGGGLGEESLKWLDRAVQYDPQSAEARLRRARFHRIRAISSPDAGSTLQIARDDLEAAERLPIADPRLRLTICAEWLGHNELERAAASLAALGKVPPESLRRFGIGSDDWDAQQFLHASELELRAGRIEKAVVLADEVLKRIQEKTVRLAIFPTIIELYVNGGRMDDARRCLAEYTAIPSEGEEAPAMLEARMMTEALVARAEHKPYRVIAVLQRFLARAPQRPELLKMLAEAYLHTGQSQRAIQAMQEYLQRRPDDAEVTGELVREQLRQGDWAAALSTGRQAQRLSAANLDLLRVEASAKALLNHVDDAADIAPDSLRAEVARLQEAAPRSTAVRVTAALVELAAGNFEAAVQVLKAAAVECDDTLEAELMLVRVYAAKKDMEQAILTARQASQRHPRQSSSWETLSLLLERDGKLDEARQALADGVAAAEAGSPELRDLSLELAQMELRTGQRVDGLNRLRELVKADPAEVPARSTLLSQPETRGDPKVAQQLIDEIRAVQGDGGVIWRVHQSELWLADDQWRGKQQQITELLQACIDSDPTWPAPAALLGELYTRLGNARQAEAVYRRTLTANPAALPVAGRLLDLLEAQQRFSEAREMLSRLEASPEALRDRRVILAVGEGEYSRAIEELRQKVVANPKDVNTLALLARLVYRSDGDADAALAYLDRADKERPGAIAVVATRVAILREENRIDEAQALLDKAVEAEATLETLSMRASFFELIGEPAAAEADLRRVAEMTEGTQGWELLARFYVGQKRIGEAIAAAEKALTISPSDARIQRALMVALLERDEPGDRERAARMLDELEKSAPDDPGLLWTRAVTLLNSGAPADAARAEEILRRIVEVDPSAVDPQLRLIGILMSRGALNDARELAIRARGANPTSSKLLLARAEVERRLRQPALAIELIRVALKESPGDPVSVTLFADCAVDLREPRLLAEAQKLLVEHAASAPDNLELRLAQARVLEAMNQADEAVALLESTPPRSDPAEQMRVLLAQVEVHVRRGELEKGADKLEQAGKLRPDDAEFVRLRIVVAAQQKRLDDVAAIAAGFEAKDRAQAMVLMTGAAALAGSPNAEHRKQAGELYSRVLALAPDLTEARLSQASLAYQSGEVDAAIAAYRAVLSAQATNVRALNDLAWMLAESKQQYDEALVLADRGLQLAPDNPNLRDTRAFTLAKLPGRELDARKEYERCLELSAPGSSGRARTLLRLARVCAALGDDAAVNARLREASEIDRARSVFGAQEKAEIETLLREHKSE